MKFVRYWLPMIGWMAVIFFLSGRSSVQVADEPLLNFIFFKTLHVIEYSILYILTLRALRQSMHFKERVSMLVVAFFIVVLYAVTDEIHQLFVPTREGRFRDVIIDATGANLSWLLIEKLLPGAPK